MKFLSMLFIIFIAFSCTKKSETAEGALQEYIQASSDAAQSRSFYTDRTAGKFLAAIESMDEEEFSEFAALKGVGSVKFKILHKNCQELRCFLTYEIEYRQNFEPNQEFESVSKKIAEMVQVEGYWKIADVTNLKTYIDSKTPIKVEAEDEEVSD